MSSPIQDNKCYKTANTFAPCIAFHFDELRRCGFNASQLIGYSLDPNPDAADDKDAPPHKLSIAFSTADVVILGWRLDFLADKLGENVLSAVGILPKRYAELYRTLVFVSSIVIKPVGKDSDKKSGEPLKQ